MNKYFFMREEVAIVAAVAAVLVTTVIATTVFVGYVSSISCEKQAKKMGVNSDWELLQGCMIEVKPGKWAPLKNYRAI